MGTETTQTLRPYRRIVAVVKFIDPLMGTETKYQPITNECMPHYVKLNNPPDGDGNLVFAVTPLPMPIVLLLNLLIP